MVDQKGQKKSHTQDQKNKHHRSQPRFDLLEPQEDLISALRKQALSPKEQGGSSHLRKDLSQVVLPDIRTMKSVVGSFKFLDKGERRALKDGASQVLSSS